MVFHFDFYSSTKKMLNDVEITMTDVIAVFIAMITAVFIYLIIEMIGDVMLLVLLVFNFVVYFTDDFITESPPDFDFASLCLNLQSQLNPRFLQLRDSIYEDALYQEDCFKFQALL